MERPDPALILSRGEWAFLVGGFLAGIPLSLVLAMARLPFIQAPHGRERLPFELHALLVLVLAGLVAAQKLRGSDLGSVRFWTVFLPFLVVAAQLTLYCEFSVKSYDYLAYEEAAQRIRAGEAIYDLGPEGSDWGYLYPPLLSQSLAAVHAIVTSPLWLDLVHPLAGRSIAPWDQVFFVFQAVALAAVLGAWYLLYRLLRQLYLRQIEAVVGASAFLALNGLVVRNLAYNQVNLLVLDSFLAAHLLAGASPLLAGLVLAGGFHLKLWPVTLLPQWVLERRWLALATAVTSAGLLVLVSLLSGSGSEVWHDFLRLLHSFPTSHSFRDNSIHGVLALLSRDQGDEWLLAAATRVLAVAGSVWVVWRCARRRSAFRARHEVRNAFGRTVASAEAARALNAADLIALPLLVSPVSWEHHYLLAVPLSAVALVLVGSRRREWALVATVLIFCPPIFNIAILSLHRLVGLLLLLAVTQPGVVTPARSGSIGAASEHESVQALRPGPEPR